MSVFVDFDEVKAKIGIPEVLKVLGIADQFREGSGMLVGVCPFPAHSHNPVRPNPNQFTIRKIDGIWMWKCWGDCQAAGTVITFLERYLEISPAHVRLWLHEHFANRLGAKPQTGRGEDQRICEKTEPESTTPVVTDSDSPEPSSETSSEDLSKYTPIRFTLQTDPHAEYLRQRGLTPETIATFQLGLCQRGLLKGYIAIPVWEYPRGQFPYGYLGRWAGAQDDSHPRYKWPKGFPVTRFVYGIEQALQTEPRRPLIVVEGAFKLYHLRQNGFPNTVASFGASLSDEQARQLIATGRDIVLMFDGDPAARQAMQTAAEKLLAHTWVRTVPLDDGIEPDHLTAEALATLLNFTHHR
ncbi:MAG: hypothetical protein Tsb009_36790 [Planctomycetaceae bacterium]